MPKFELSQFVITLQKRRFQVGVPDATTAKQHVSDGCACVVVSREAVLFKTPLSCKEVASTAAPTNVKAATDQDGCPVWVVA